MSKRFSGAAALIDVSLDLSGGEIRALLGENGSGKSTLIKVLSGYHVPEREGKVHIGGVEIQFGQPGSSYAAGARFVHQDLGLVETESILDNLLLTAGFPTRLGTISRRRARDLAQRAMDGVGLTGLDLAVDVRNLSPAQRTGVAIARALIDGIEESVRLLVLDEPTATLPEAEAARLLEIVRAVAAHGVAVLYVTHRLDEVFVIADSATILREGRLVLTRPTAELDREALVRHITGAELEEVRRTREELPTGHGERLLEVTDLSAGRVNSVSFEADAGEIVGVAGLTGSGRDQLCAALFGGLPRHTGDVLVAGRPVAPTDPREALRAGMMYLPADRKGDGGVFNLSVRENLSLPELRSFWRGWRLSVGAERAEAQVWFDRLDIRPRHAIEQPLHSLSGGNQQKVLFAKWLRTSPRVLLLDEPTQGVDVTARAQLHRQILEAAQRGSTVLVSTSDLEEMEALCDRILVFSAGRLVDNLSGSQVSVTDISRAEMHAATESDM